LPSAIERLKAEATEANLLAKALRAAALKVDREFHVGTGVNEINLPEHRCYAIGISLGMDRYVSHLRFDRRPSLAPTNSEAAHIMRVIAISMDNFQSSVDEVVANKHEQRAESWNLDCAGHMQIANVSVPRTGVSTFYQITNDGKVLRVLGAVEAGFASRLRQAIEKNPKIEYVALGSGGGLVYEALSAGRFIRSMGIKTTLWNNCYSACPLVFMGGEDRIIYSPYPSLGFHQIYSKEGASAPNSRVYVDLFRYLQDMGVDARFVVQNMLVAPPDKMNLISGKDESLCKNQIATWIQRGGC